MSTQAKLRTAWTAAEYEEMAIVCAVLYLMDDFHRYWDLAKHARKNERANGRAKS